MAQEALESLKAENIVTVVLGAESSLADAMMICTANSSRHACSLYEKVVEAYHLNGIRGVHVEGEDGGSWILVDTGDVLIHIFLEETRELYNLEKLWGKPFPESKDEDDKKSIRTDMLSSLQA